MTISPAEQDFDDDALPIPEGAFVLPIDMRDESDRSLAVAALQQAMRQRRLSLPLGPETDLANPARLLQLNRVSVQLVTAGLYADELDVPITQWRDKDRSPQLLAAALVDEDNAVVLFQGVLAADQFMAAVPDVDLRSDTLRLPVECFDGGIERMLLFVQLLQPEALPRFGDKFADQLIGKPGLQLLDLLAGALATNPWSECFGASLQPVTAGAFRGDAAIDLSGLTSSPLMLTVPLGLSAHAVVSGQDVTSCVETFTLSVVTYGQITQEFLRLRLASQLSGDLLPDGLGLTVSTGDSLHKLVADGSTELLLDLPVDSQLFSVSIDFPGRSALQLPPLSLHSS